MQNKKIRFRNFQEDLHKEVHKSKRFKMLFEIESAKIKLANKLTEMREQMGLTQAELAKKMGVSQQLISKIESGDDNISLETLVKFVYILGMTLKIGVGKRKKEEGALEFAA